jgi:hypothetical protein
VTSDDAAAWAAVFGVILSAVGLFFVYLQLRGARKDAAAENERQRRQATFDFLARTASEAIRTYSLVPPNGTTTESIGSFLKKVENRETAEFFALRGYLNLLENLLAGVNMKVLDEEVMQRTSASRILRAWEAFGAWIQKERVAVRQPRLWIEIEQFADRVKADRAREVSTSGG